MWRKYRFTLVWKDLGIIGENWLWYLHGSKCPAAVKLALLRIPLQHLFCFLEHSLAASFLWNSFCQIRRQIRSKGNFLGQLLTWFLMLWVSCHPLSQVTGWYQWVFFVWKVGTHFLLLCFWKVESGAVSNSCIVGEKKLYPSSQKTVSSLHCSFYAFIILRRERKVCVTLVCSWVVRGEGLETALLENTGSKSCERHGWVLVWAGAVSAAPRWALWVVYGSQGRGHFIPELMD